MDNKTIPTLILPGEENTQEEAAPAQAEPAAQAAPAAQTAPCRVGCAGGSRLSGSG